MPWFRVDDQLPSLASTTRIPRAHRRAAIGLWALAGAWSAGQLTDGHIPEHMLDELSGTTEDATWLVTAGIWEPAEDGWQFVEWAPNQPLRAAVLEQRRKNAEKVQNWRTRNRVTPEVTDGVSDVDVTPPPTRPDPTSPSSIDEGGRPLRDSPFCEKHPTGTVGKPCRACGDARRSFDAAQKSKFERPTIVGVASEPDCPKHPHNPHPNTPHGCPKCNEEAKAQVAA